MSAGEAYRTRLFTARGVGSGGRAAAAAPLLPGVRSAHSRPIATADGCTSQHHPRGRARRVDRGRLPDESLRLATQDLRLAVTEGRESNLVLLVVDASGSMAARRRMGAVKAAALSLLLDAYQRRDKVGLITFRGAEATLALPPTSSIDTAARRLQTCRPVAGRRWPSLICAAETLRLERIRDPRRRPLLVLVTDGRATRSERGQPVAAGS